MPATDVLLVSLGGTTGLRDADAELAASLRRAGARVELVAARRPPELRTLPLLELAWALAARRAARAGIAAHAPRAVLYSSVTAALLAPAPRAIRFDAPAAGNRRGRHGIWQRPAERRRLAAAPLLVPWSEGALAEAPRPHADAIVVPVPVAPSGPPADRDAADVTSRANPGSARAARDIAAVTYGANPEKKGLDRVFAAWLRARRDGEELVVAGGDAVRGEAMLARALRDAGHPVPGDRAGAEAALDAAPVRFVGPLPRQEFRALLRRARVFVTAPRREDYGIAQLEALADGCALVTTAAPGPYAALPLARALDPRLVAGDLAPALRAALDAPSPAYAGRAAELLAPFRPEAVDRVVAEELLPRLLGYPAP